MLNWSFSMRAMTISLMIVGVLLSVLACGMTYTLVPIALLNSGIPNRTTSFCSLGICLLLDLGHGLLPPTLAPGATLCLEWWKLYPLQLGVSPYPNAYQRDNK